MGFSMKIRGGQDRSAKHRSRFILWQNRAKSHRAHTVEICYKPLLKVDNEGTSRILMPRERGFTVEYALTRRSALGAAGAGAGGAGTAGSGGLSPAALTAAEIRELK